MLDYKSLSLQDFIMKIDSNSYFSCYICHKPFKSFGNLRRHLFTHDPESRIYECHLCCSKFAREYLLRNHIKYVHELRGKYVGNARRKVSCSICDKQWVMSRIMLQKYVLWFSTQLIQLLLTMKAFIRQLEIAYNNGTREKEADQCKPSTVQNLW